MSWCPECGYDEISAAGKCLSCGWSIHEVAPLEEIPPDYARKLMSAVRNIEDLLEYRYLHMSTRELRNEVLRIIQSSTQGD